MKTNSSLQVFAASFRASIRHAVYLSRAMDVDGELTSMQVSTLTMATDASCRVSQIAMNLGIRVPSATEQIIKLEKAGLVLRKPDPSDARAVNVTLTSAGRARLAAANTQRNQRMAELLEALSESERAALAAALPIIEKLNNTALDSR